MSVDYRLPLRWREARGRLACDNDKALKLLNIYGPRVDENAGEHRARLAQESDPTRQIGIG